MEHVLSSVPALAARTTVASAPRVASAHRLPCSAPPAVFSTRPAPTLTPKANSRCQLLRCCIARNPGFGPTPSSPACLHAIPLEQGFEVLDHLAVVAVLPAAVRGMVPHRQLRSHNKGAGARPMAAGRQRGQGRHTRTAAPRRRATGKVVLHGAGADPFTAALLQSSMDANGAARGHDLQHTCSMHSTSAAGAHLPCGRGGVQAALQL